jgi:hypothetical protein
MSLGTLNLSRRSRAESVVPGAPFRSSFYEKLESALEAEGFDREIEELAHPYYARRRGRRSIPPGIYFRMLFVGAIEGIASQRELAWRCGDSLSLRRFLGFGANDPTPDHSTLTLLRRRLPAELHERSIRMILAAARRHDVLRGRRISIALPWSGTIRAG